MPDLNKVILLGRLTKTPQLRYTPAGSAVVDLGIATSRKWKTGPGELKHETTYSQVTMWGKQAETIAKYLDRGDSIFIEGRLHLEKWKGPDGGRRQKLKVMGESFQFVSTKQQDESDEGDIGDYPE